MTGESPVFQREMRGESAAGGVIYARPLLIGASVPSSAVLAEEGGMSETKREGEREERRERERAGAAGASPRSIIQDP